MPSDYDEMRALCERAQQAYAGIAALQQQLTTIRAETRALIEQARHMTGPVICAAAPIVAMHDELYHPWEEPNDHALHTLRITRALLTEYPIEWQVKLVKVLAARTAAVAWDQLQAQRVISA